MVGWGVRKKWSRGWRDGPSQETKYDVDELFQGENELGGQVPRNEAAYQKWEELGNPKYMLAPMIRQSELAFRMLVRNHGCQLCYTPMVRAKEFLQCKTDLERSLYLHPDSGHALDRPLVVQFCGHDPEELLQAAKLVEGICDAVDINLGCPQKCAEKDLFGAFLLDHPTVVSRLVEHLSKNLKIPVWCKIRLLPTFEASMQFVQMLERSGASAIAIHGRFREQRHHEGIADWSAIRALKKMVGVPVIANGNILGLDDVHKCLEYTGCDGVMSAISILRMPKLFESTLFSARPLEDHEKKMPDKDTMKKDKKKEKEQFATTAQQAGPAESGASTVECQAEIQVEDKIEADVDTHVEKDVVVDLEAATKRQELERAQLEASLECAAEYIGWAAKYPPHDRVVIRDHFFSIMQKPLQSKQFYDVWCLIGNNRLHTPWQFAQTIKVLRVRCGMDPGPEPCMKAIKWGSYEREDLDDITSDSSALFAEDDDVEDY